MVEPCDDAYQVFVIMPEITFQRLDKKKAPFLRSCENKTSHNKRFWLNWVAFYSQSFTFYSQFLKSLVI